MTATALVVVIALLVVVAAVAVVNAARIAGWRPGPRSGSRVLRRLTVLVPRWGLFAQSVGSADLYVVVEDRGRARNRVVALLNDPARSWWAPVLNPPHRTYQLGSTLALVALSQYGPGDVDTSAHPPSRALTRLLQAARRAVPASDVRHDLRLAVLASQPTTEGPRLQQVLAADLD